MKSTTPITSPFSVVKVVKRTLRTLFVAGKATREYQHAVVCMMGDPVIRLSCFLQSAQVSYVQQGNVVIDRLPGNSAAQWQDYDIVVLYDVDPKEISAQQISGLENTVSKGAGLLVVAGRNHGMGPLLQIHANKMRQLLPVEIDRNQPSRHEVIFDTPIIVERTPEGRATPLCRLVSNEKMNEEIWGVSPLCIAYHPVVSPQAGGDRRSSQERWPCLAERRRRLHPGGAAFWRGAGDVPWHRRDLAARRNPYGSI